jgi:hypothetical protein
MELTFDHVLSKLEEAKTAGVIKDIRYIKSLTRGKSEELEKFVGFDINLVQENKDQYSFTKVFEVSNKDSSILIAIDGQYCSMGGEYYKDNGWYEVKETVKVVKVYNKI